MTDGPYNRSLVRRGEILFSYDFLETWDLELARMNENKKGKPYSFPDSFILVVGHIRIYFHIPYRQTEGLIKATGKSLPDHPSYGHICRRVNKLTVDIKGSKIDYDDDNNNDDDVIITVDSTGIKVTNRGQWVSDKWRSIRKKKKGCLKIHVAVNIKTKEILALEVADEKVHDGKVMKKLVENALRINNNIKIKSVLADGSYDNNKNFKFLKENKIQPSIKIRRNSIISQKNIKMRNIEVRQQIKDFLQWKKKRKYGKKWIAEIVFSSIKRMFGEHTSATRFQNMVKEMVLKISLYNLFRGMT